ncbi:MAG: hypothetical protein WD011_05225 [Nitriliruptoraceae bacterium]
MIQVQLPPQLRSLAHVSGVVQIDVPPPVTLGAILDVLEGRAPVLRGTIRDPVSGRRRAFIRFFIGTNDYSHVAMDEPLPDEVANGTQPVRIIGAIAGG